MLIDKYGNIDYDITGVCTTKENIELLDNQFLQWTPSEKRLELWNGKEEYLNYEYDHDRECKIKRITYWNQNSILSFMSWIK